MQVLGPVMKFRESSFAGKDGKVIEMVYVDIYDETVGMVQCEMRKNGVPLVKGDQVTGDVLRIKQAKWNPGGFSLAVSGLKVVVESPSVSSPVSSSVPPAPSVVVPPVPPPVGGKKS